MWPFWPRLVRWHLWPDALSNLLVCQSAPRDGRGPDGDSLPCRAPARVPGRRGRWPVRRRAGRRLWLFAAAHVGPASAPGVRRGRPLGHCPHPSTAGVALGSLYHDCGSLPSPPRDARDGPPGAGGCAPSLAGDAASAALSGLCPQAVGAGGTPWTGRATAQRVAVHSGEGCEKLIQTFGRLICPISTKNTLNAFAQFLAVCRSLQLVEVIPCRPR